MDFSFNEEQKLLRNSLGAFLADRYPFARRRAIADSAAGWDRSVWQAFGTELGILSMSLPEQFGGLGCDAVSTLVVMEELGRELVVEPFLESIVLCGGLLQKLPGPQSNALLEELGAGAHVLALAWSEPQSRFNASRVGTRARRNSRGWVLDGLKSVVVGAPWADGLLVTARTAGDEVDETGISLFWVEADRPGVEISGYPMVDGRRAADVRLSAVELPPAALIGAEGQLMPHLSRVLDAGIAALCAEGVGIIERMHADTVSYTKQRKQFGQPISGFQVLQHRMVDMHIECEMAKSATYLATLLLESTPVERALAASAAKVTVGEACRFVGQNAIQLHGGMGMTDDLAISHYFRRATVIEAELGSVDYHVARYAGLMKSRAEGIGR